MMMFNNDFMKAVAAPMVAAIITSGLVTGSAVAAEDEAPGVAFPDKYMLRLGAYFVDGTDTQFSVNSPLGLGAVIDYQRDLGGESRDTIPRIDAYYRFNERHRIDFTTFAIDRKGSTTLAIDITIGDENFSEEETINSDIKYTLYKLGYAYSFYHSPKVELSFTAGLNITSYDLSFSTSTGDKAEAAGFTAPLPMFGLRMGYAITPKWSVQYLAESFFIEFEDSFKGALVSYELSTEYKLFKHFAIGAGLARMGTNVEVNDDNWKGQVSDSYRGYTLFGTFYF
ncbi:MAG: hypothetical protein GQ572_00250 [Gammaproteobacteria bacterium]|nr:hypothetical protein [Gammaproteobacteria bacterium]